MVEKYKSMALVQEYDTNPIFQISIKNSFDFPTLEQIGFEESPIKFKPHNLKIHFKLSRY
jgi:deoxyribodipyrimidine photo-lyase